MKNKLIGICALLTSVSAFSHSGGTDANGCHTNHATGVHHCHNESTDTGGSGSSLELSAWDLNFGYQKQIPDTIFIPYAGLSLGEADVNYENPKLGLDLGLKFNNGFYFGYVTSSESVQVGYEYVHISAKSGMIGLGFRIPFNLNNAPETTKDSRSKFYFSASGQLSDPKE